MAKLFNFLTDSKNRREEIERLVARNEALENERIRKLELEKEREAREKRREKQNAAFIRVLEKYENGIKEKERREKEREREDLNRADLYL